MSEAPPGPPADPAPPARPAPPPPPTGAADPRPSPGPEPARPSLAPHVLRFANQLHSLVSSRDLPHLASLIEEEAKAWKDTSVRVVVAGEIKRGKTSFINALVRRPGLLPVDADVATSVHLAVRYGETESIQVARQRYDTDEESVEQFTIGPDDLVHYASMLGDEERRRGVTAVEVRLPEPILERGLALVDTPGVGGMTQGHRDIALASLQLADALIFTISSQEPILRTELEFLAHASARIDTVLFVMTKTDANAAWEAMRDEDVAKLRAFGEQLQGDAAAGGADEETTEIARRFGRLFDAPFLPVSARLADRGLAREAAGRTDAGAELRQRSGLADIDQILNRTIDSREQVRLRNIVNLCSMVLARLEGEERDRVRAAEGDHAAVERELAEQQARLEELIPRQAKWRQRFATDVQRTQTEIQRLVAREVARTEKHYRDYVNNAGKQINEVMEALPADLEASLLAMWTNLSVSLIERLDRSVLKLADEFSLDDVSLEFSGLAATDTLDEVGVHDRKDPDAGKADLLGDGLPLLSSVSMFGSMAARVFGGGAVMLPGLIIAAPIAYFRYKARQRAELRREYLRIVHEVMATARQEVASELSLKLIEAREVIEDAVDQALTARRKAVEARRKELQAFLAQDAKKQKQLASEASARLAEISQLREQADSLRDQLTH